MFKEIHKGCNALCSKKYPSVLRDTSNENMSTFFIDKMNSEIQQKAQLLHSVLQHSVKNSTLGTVVTMVSGKGQMQKRNSVEKIVTNSI